MVDEKRLLSQIDDMREEIIRFTQEIVKIPTVNPPGDHYPKCAELIGKQLEELGLEVELIEVPESILEKFNLEGRRINVIGTLKGTSRRPVLHFNGHYDVVAPGDGWTVDPFSAKIEHGKMWGRGTCDMKGGVAAMIMAAGAIARAGIQLKGDIQISAVPDEETGSFAGAKYIVNEGYALGDMVIVTEPSEVDVIDIAHKGALWLEVTTLGKTAHGSLPHFGVNAVEKMAKAILELNKLQETLQTRETKAPMMSEAKTATIMVGGTIQGGLKTNIVPDKCTISLDRRLIPEETMEDAKKEILNVLENLKREDPEFNYDVKTIQEADAAWTDENEQIVQSAKKCVQKVLGKEPDIKGLTGYTDLRVFAKSMPGIIYGPGDDTKAHAPDEYILVDDLVTATKVMALIAIDLLH